MEGQQTDAEIRAVLSHLVGNEIAGLQILGVNSLKSLSPTPAELIGQQVLNVDVADRVFVVEMRSIRLRVDLQRVGKLVWRPNSEPFKIAPGVPMPTVRILLANGAALDLTEPSNTKRITVTLSARV